ncbi:unnamed protein product [Rhizoctonia solani]|uniref:Uncharacterized protein n=1 Tax=Rhizoctonia solani TaxID=456999 RepID=A0A8H2X175_9AGAM|nr:unnamed protein product [Rhizoctonia solani]
MFVNRAARSARRTLTEAIVDLSVKSDAVKGESLPILRELRTYLESLESVVLVYHHQRRCRATRSDHIYVVFESNVDADDFLKTWLLWDDAHTLKEYYVLQRIPHFLNGDISRIEYEMKCIEQAASFPRSMKLPRFEGTAFARPSDPESGEVIIRKLREVKYAVLDRATADQVFRRVDLDDAFEILSLERGNVGVENADLKAQVSWFKILLNEARLQKSSNNRHE